MNVRCLCGQDYPDDYPRCPYCGLDRDKSQRPAGPVSGWPVFMVLAGMAMVAYFFLFYDTSVPVSGGGRVHNLGLMQERQLGLIAGFGVLITGVVWTALSRKRG